MGVKVVWIPRQLRKRRRGPDPSLYPARLSSNFQQPKPTPLTRNRIMRLLRHAIICAAALATTACSSRSAALPAPEPGAAPYSLVESRTERPLDLGALADRAAAVDIVFFGELHDDPGTHQLQLALLRALAERQANVTLSLEMFERDVQPSLDAYLAGRITEAAFLAESRPWPNYAADYRPLVEFAKARGWPVLASNVPRPLAALVARSGLDTLSTLPSAERMLAASDLRCPRDSYYDRFMTTMGEHPGMSAEMLQRFYEAQCIKDETMAESLVAALATRPGAVVVHMNGSFHSDYGDGVPARVERRRPGLRLMILTGIPVAELGVPPIAENRERADYLLFTKEPAGN